MGKFKVRLCHLRLQAILAVHLRAEPSSLKLPLCRGCCSVHVTRDLGTQGTQVILLRLGTKIGGLLRTGGIPPNRGRTEGGLSGLLGMRQDHPGQMGQSRLPRSRAHEQFICRSRLLGSPPPGALGWHTSNDASALPLRGARCGAPSVTRQSSSANTLTFPHPTRAGAGSADALLGRLLATALDKLLGDARNEADKARRSATRQLRSAFPLPLSAAAPPVSRPVRRSSPPCAVPGPQLTVPVCTGEGRGRRAAATPRAPRERPEPAIEPALEPALSPAHVEPLARIAAARRVDLRRERRCAESACPGLELRRRFIRQAARPTPTNTLPASRPAPPRPAPRRLNSLRAPPEEPPRRRLPGPVPRGPRLRPPHLPWRADRGPAAGV